MEKISTYLSEAIARENPNLTEVQKATIKFGLECLLSELSKFTAYFIIFYFLSLALNYWTAFVFICIPRLFAGGYHAKTYWGCFIVTLCGFGIAIFTGAYLDISFLCKLVLLLVSVIIAAVYAPVDHFNKPIVNKKRRRKFKVYSLICFIVFGIVGLIFDHPLATTGVVALLVEALSLPIGFYLNKRGGNQ